MALANYTTRVPVQQTIAEIQHLLVSHGAVSVLIDYDADRLPAALSFRIVRDGIDLHFRLPCNWRAALVVLREQRVIPASWPDKDADARAQRVAWRVCGDWLRAQLALIAIGSAKLEQLMLSHLITPDGSTVYERLQGQRFAGLALPAPDVE